VFAAQNILPHMVTSHQSDFWKMLDPLGLIRYS